MIRFRPTALIAGATLFCAGALLPVAEGETLAMTPPLDEALPWADTPQGVKTTAPLLLNPTTVVPAGAVVRTFYVRPSAGDDGSDGPKLISHDDSREAAYSRSGGGVSAADSEAKKTLN